MIKVGVYDSGVDFTTASLATLENAALSRNNIVSEKHGTSVAEVIASFDANISISAVNVLLARDPLLFADMQRFDIANHSWGIGYPYTISMSSAYSLGILSSIETAASLGRNGLGTIVVNSAGNYGLEGRDPSTWQMNNSRFSITVSNDKNYASDGASILTHAPTDISTSSGVFGGTSASAAYVSGMVTEILSINPNLGWRDVKELLSVATDSDSANRLAQYWTVTEGPAKTSVNEILDSELISVSGRKQFSFNIDRPIDIESVTLEVSFAKLDMSSYIDVIAPNGTVSRILEPGRDNITSGVKDWIYLSEEFRGMDSVGTWTVRTGFDINYAKLNVYGAEQNVNDTYHFNNDFNLKTIVDTDGGNDWIDFSAMSADGVYYDMNPGMFSLIDRQVVGTGATTLIENVVGTSLFDVIISNKEDNVIYGGAASDIFVFNGVFGHDKIMDFNGDKIKIDRPFSIGYNDSGIVLSTGDSSISLVGVHSFEQSFIA